MNHVHNSLVSHLQQNKWLEKDNIVVKNNSPPLICVSLLFFEREKLFIIHSISLFSLIFLPPLTSFLPFRRTYVISSELEYDIYPTLFEQMMEANLMDTSKKITSWLISSVFDSFQVVDDGQMISDLNRRFIPTK